MDTAYSVYNFIMHNYSSTRLTLHKVSFVRRSCIEKQIAPYLRSPVDKPGRNGTTRIVEVMHVCCKKNKKKNPNSECAMTNENAEIDIKGHNGTGRKYHLSAYATQSEFQLSFYDFIN